MMFLAIVTAGLVTGVIGLAFCRILGWPTTADGARKWGYALLTIALLYSELPKAVSALTHADLGLDLPSVNLGDAFPALLVAGLAMLGYIGWTQGAAAREEQARRDARASEQPRHREAPPAPVRGRSEGTFAPRGTGAGHDPLFDDEA